MELKSELNYNQILKLIHQLPKKEIEQLTYALLSEIKSEKSKTTIQELILQAPTWSDSDFNEFNKAKDHFNKSRIA